MNQFLTIFDCTAFGQSPEAEAHVSLDLDTYDDGGVEGTVNGQHVSIPPIGICRHGVFVAGLGRDIPCGPCEAEAWDDPLTAADLLARKRRLVSRIEDSVKLFESLGVPANLLCRWALADDDRNGGHNAWGGRVLGSITDEAWATHKATRMPDDGPILKRAWGLRDDLLKVEDIDRDLARAAAVSADPTFPYEDFIDSAAKRALYAAQESGFVGDDA